MLSRRRNRPSGAKSERPWLHTTNSVLPGRYSQRSTALLFSWRTLKSGLPNAVAEARRVAAPRAPAAAPRRTRCRPRPRTRAGPPPAAWRKRSPKRSARGVGHLHELLEVARADERLRVELEREGGGEDVVQPRRQAHRRLVQLAEHPAPRARPRSRPARAHVLPGARVPVDGRRQRQVEPAGRPHVHERAQRQRPPVRPALPAARPGPCRTRPSCGGRCRTRPTRPSTAGVTMAGPAPQRRNGEPRDVVRRAQVARPQVAAG